MLNDEPLTPRTKISDMTPQDLNFSYNNSNSNLHHIAIEIPKSIIVYGDDANRLHDSRVRSLSHAITPRRINVQEREDLLDPSKIDRSNLTSDEYINLIVDLRKIAMKLIEKYIQIGSNLEINISYSERTKILNIRDGWEYEGTKGILGGKQGILNQLIRLYKLFDDSIYALFKLMSYSFGRFAATNEYFEVEQKMSNDLELKKQEEMKKQKSLPKIVLKSQNSENTVVDNDDSQYKLHVQTNENHSSDAIETKL